MDIRKWSLVVAAGLVAAVSAGAWGGEEEGAPPAKGRPFRQGAEARQGGLEQGQGAQRPMAPGMDIPLVREELQRHMEAMRTLLLGQRDLAQQVGAEGKALRDKETPPADMDKALADKFGAQAQAVATQLADELAKHYENVTKIYKDNHDELVKQLAASVLKRMANREAGPRLGGPGGEKGGRLFPKGKDAPPKAKGEQPENF
jgi:hypothetical protein